MIDEATRIFLADPQAYLLAELGLPKITRNQYALTYALALRSANEVDWPLVNRAIIDRWSLSGLKYIKERAWKLTTAQST